MKKPKKMPVPKKVGKPPMLASASQPPMRPGMKKKGKKGMMP